MAQLVAATMRSPESKCRRTRCATKKYSDFVDKPISGVCPGCNKFVTKSENGVVCSSCVAYWHYDCANVTEGDIKQLGDKDFYCSRHDNISGGGTQVNENAKVEPYSLNMKSFYKRSMINTEKKDKGKQYLVSLNTATYLIMLSKLLEWKNMLGSP